MQAEWWRSCYDPASEPRAPRQPAGAAASSSTLAPAEETSPEEDEDDTGGGPGEAAGPSEPAPAAVVRTSLYRGVSRRYGRWKARIKQNGTDLAIGDFDNELDAARAYDEKARELHGAAAVLNFPDR